jgi:hypothetical protein
MKRYFLLLAILAVLIFPVAGININVSVASKGSTYIEWQWDAGYVLTHILIDDTEICGYETTNNSIIRTGLAPNSLHTINVTDNINYGDNRTHTTGGGSAVTNITVPALISGVIGGLIALVFYIRRKKK